MTKLGQLSQENKKWHKQAYYPVAKVHAEEATGSGSVIYSQQCEKDDEVYSYVLTNHHVVAKNIDLDEKFDPTLKQERLQETLQPVQVEFFSYNNYSRAVGSQKHDADIVAWSHMDQHDLALLRLRDTESELDHVAKMYPYEHRKDIHMREDVWAVGAGLGYPVFQTNGQITNAKIDLESETYVATNSPICGGNSGGALFKEDSGDFYLIGVPARVAIQGWGDVANHIGFAIPIETVYKFLKDNCFEHIWKDDHNPVDDREEREKKIEDAKEGD